MLNPHPVHTAVFRGRVVASDQHRDPKGRITSLTLVIEEPWAEEVLAGAPKELRSGRKLVQTSTLPARSTYWSAMLTGERLGPLIPYLDQGLKGMPVVVGGRPAGGRPSIGTDQEVILLFKAEVHPDQEQMKAWRKERKAAVPAVVSVAK